MRQPPHRAARQAASRPGGRASVVWYDETGLRRQAVEVDGRRDSVRLEGTSTLRTILEERARDSVRAEQWRRQRDSLREERPHGQRAG